MIKLSNIKIGKYLDQPLLVSRVGKYATGTLIGGSALYAFHDSKKAPVGKKDKRFIKNVMVLAGTIAPTLIAIKKLKINGKALLDIIPLKKAQEVQTKIIDEFLANNKVSNGIKELLKKAKTKHIKLGKIPEIQKELNATQEGKTLLEKIFPNPKSKTFKESLGEIGRLSVLGAIPIIGGVAGGITGDLITGDKSRKKLQQK